MADLPSEDILNNNYEVKRYAVKPQRKKVNKPCTNCFFKILKFYKTYILVCTVFVATIIGIFYYGQPNTSRKQPNIPKKLDVKPEPNKFDNAGRNIYQLQRIVFDLREKQRITEEKIRLLHGMFEHIRATMKQNGGFINLKQVNKIINDELQLYDSDKVGAIDYACLYTGASILATPNTSSIPIKVYDLFGFPIQTIFSEPTELITPDVTPKHCFAFWGTNGRVQIALSRKIYINAVTMEHAPETLIGSEIKLAPHTFTVYGFEDARNITLTEIGTFDYTIRGSTIQTFTIPKQNQTTAFAYVELRILSNHGRADFTCVYRFRVHGYPY